jgi:hypothetical protein
LPGYVYAVRNSDVYVNLFLGNQANLKVNDKDVELSQTTNYPWNGDIALEVKKNRAGRFALKIRIPGWVRNQPVPGSLYRYSDTIQPHYSVSVNGQAVESNLENGYFTIERTWKRGDRVSIHFDMAARSVVANKAVTADRGRVAVERGPIVYCAEGVDNDFDLRTAILVQSPKFVEISAPDLLHGIIRLQTDAQTVTRTSDGRLTLTDVKLNLIPYYAWCHRGAGTMRVWLPQDLNESMAEAK